MWIQNIFLSAVSIAEKSTNTKFEMAREQGLFYWLTVLGGVKVLQEFVIWLLWNLATKFKMGQEVYYFWLLVVIIVVMVGSIWLVAAFASSIKNLDRLPTHILEDTLNLIILDVLIEALLKPYFEDVFKNFTYRDAVKFSKPFGKAMLRWHH